MPAALRRLKCENAAKPKSEGSCIQRCLNRHTDIRRSDNCEDTEQLRTITKKEYIIQDSTLHLLQGTYESI